ncbi:MAG: TIGR03067 domain-containing protein [Verrucomicrobia bacterium]|nr:TIGR03067 domain-containing protein [Verrucomicrobiota bacterium]
MKTLLHLLALWIVLNLPGTAAVAADDDAAARKKIVGTWRGFAVEGAGEKPDQGPVKLEVTITETEISAIKDGKEDMGAGAYKLGLAQSPQGLEGTRTRGLGPKGPYLGIFKLEGDTLKWCVANPRYPRPTEFKTVKGQFLLILKRAEQITGKP